MQLELKIDVPAERLADLMITAIECNDMTRAWCNGVLLKGSGMHKSYTSPWYADPLLWTRPNFVIEIQEVLDESQEPVGKNIAKHRCDKAAFMKGLRLMAAKHPHSFADFMAENEDAITADVFLQCVALGEVRYG